MTLTHDCGNDAAAYVLGALDSHELTSFTRHLSGCSVCQAEVESFQQLVNVLPESVPQYAVSKTLRHQVIADVREDALRRGQTARVQDRRSLVPRLGGGSNWPPVWARNPVPRFHGGLVGSAVALVLVLAVVIVGVSAGGHKDKSEIFYKAEVGGSRDGLVVSGGHAQLVVHDLSELPDTSRYEVWLESPGGKPEPTRVLFNTTSSGDDAVPIPNSLAGITKVLVTEEPYNGSSVPTTNPVVTARIG
jgi:anti-sigma-K factor RskA